MKARIILFLSILIPFALVFIYIWSTATDLVFRDDMYMIKGGFIESYLKGTLTFADLWRPTNSMRIFGGALLHIASIKWFSMNSKLIVFLIPFLMLCSTVLIYGEYRKSLLPENSPAVVAATFAFLTFIIFNIIQWESLLFAGGIGAQFPTPFIIASFISLELFLLKGELKYLPAALILPPLAVLGFGGKLVFVFAPTLAVTFLCYLMTRRTLLTTQFWYRAAALSLFLAAIAFLYLYRINYNDYVMPSSQYTADLLEIIDRPSDAITFLLATLGASIVGIDAFFTYEFFSFNSMVIIGFVLFLLYTLALGLYVASRMYERSYLPLFLIIQTLLFLGFMTVGRFRLGGLDYGMASRYTCVSVYGLVAVVWIFIFILTRPQRPGILLQSIMYSGLAMIFSGLLLTSFVELVTQPSKKVYFEQLREIAMRVDTASPEELSRFAERPELVRDSLRLLREHKLNVYREKR